ncbi:putative cyclin-dependent kinase 2 [Chelonid alphaherpesvirus 5]|uniref:Putative cyclin-dependent kinase 2 n=1 Tax=Chelonid alphaherpesvirus 5 TaxID=702736 RepID=V5NXA4_9ALPH|nr:putative cyclin-dependent kinase 2 [Chelonid alphaherpesvirus 5]AHA93304.1 putative cyclin-dependent kinase 2 [Chelonid alphaherpesvirus 5]
MAERVNQTLDLLSALGKGTYGQVVKAVDKATGNVIAVKITRKGKDRLTQATINEYDILTMMRHSNIITAIQLLEDDSRVFLQMEYVHASLKDFIRINSCIRRDHRRRIVSQLLSALIYLREHRIIHRDLKPDNILMNSVDDVKVADFGLAKFWHSANGRERGKHSLDVCTSWYRSPEVFLCHEYGYGLDVWSLGCVFYYLIKRESPFRAETDEVCFLTILCRMGVTRSTRGWESPKEADCFYLKVPQHLWQRANHESIPEDESIVLEERKLLCRMLTFCPDARPTAENLSADKYLSDRPCTRSQSRTSTSSWR